MRLLDPQTKESGTGGTTPPASSVSSTAITSTTGVTTPSVPTITTPPSTSKTPPAKKPSADALKVQFNIEPGDDLDILGTNDKPAEVKPVETKPTEAKPTEVKPVETKPAAEVKPAETKPPVLGEQVTTKSTDLDFTGLAPDEVETLKHMSKVSATQAIKWLKEAKELRTANYLQNPDAYMLDPQYKKMREDAQFARAEAQIWQDQLMKIKKGEAYTPLLGFDAQGQPVFDKPQPADGIAEENARQYLLYATTTAQQFQAGLQGLKQNYAQRIAGDAQQINAIQAQKFSWVGNPEQLKDIVNVPGVGERSIQQIKQDFISMLPAYHRNNILADISANMFAAIQLYAAEIRNLQAKQQVATTQAADTLRAEPTSTTRPAGSNGAPAKNKFGGPQVFVDDLGI